MLDCVGWTALAAVQHDSIKMARSKWLHMVKTWIKSEFPIMTRKTFKFSQKLSQNNILQTI